MACLLHGRIAGDAVRKACAVELSPVTCSRLCARVHYSKSSLVSKHTIRSFEASIVAQLFIEVITGARRSRAGSGHADIRKMRVASAPLPQRVVVMMPIIP